MAEFYPNGFAPLAFDTEMPPHLRERHLDRPTPHEPAQHLERIGVRVGAQKALRLERTRDGIIKLRYF